MKTARNYPKWLLLCDELLWPLVGMGLTTLLERHPADPNLQSIPYCALLHLAGCLEVSISSNEKGKHSVAVCLIRQCVEALTLVDIGLQVESYADPLLNAWACGSKTQGQLRAGLEQDVWPRYGTGLWKESWAEFFGNLSRAVQPYAHYTQELMGWQHSVVSYSGGNEFLSSLGLDTYDPLKASRITLLHSLIAWTLGRLLLENGPTSALLSRSAQIKALGVALGESKLLFKEKGWDLQLLPDVLFTPGSNWRDP